MSETLTASEISERVTNAGYVRAFYELADMLGMNARADSPRNVWENEMKPRLATLLRETTK